MPIVCFIVQQILIFDMMSEKATLIESSRGKPLIIRDSYKYFLGYKSKFELSLWRCCLTTCEAVLYTNQNEEVVADELHKNVQNHLP